MLSKEDNDLITQTDRGTPMGELFRRFWVPALLSEELPGADCNPVRVKIMGEDLVAFRDSKGKPGVIDAYCPHRGAPMFFARNEEEGIRCLYHGWKFNTAGDCVDMPNIAHGETAKNRMHTIAYPTVESANMIWVYMGPEDRKPPFPEFPYTAEVPKENVYVTRYEINCNWLQAMEGDYDPSPNGAPLVLFGLPSNDDARVRYELSLPHLGSLILKHDPNAPLQGLKDFPRDQWPPVPIVFWSFRIMVALGFAMLGLGLWSLLARLRHRLYDWRWLHRAAVVMGPAGFVAVIAGWVTTEVGRQPFTVYGLLRTTESHSPLAAPAVAASLIAFVVVYFAAFGAGTYYLLRMMNKPPEPHEDEPPRKPQRAAGITPASGIATSLPGGE